MAQRNYIEDWRGRWEYVEVYRDNYSCRKRFKYREEEAEADAYFNYLQSLDNQEISIQKQNQIAEQLKRQNELAEQQLKAQERINSRPYSQPFVPPFDPEYLEWKKKKAEEQAERDRIRMQEQQREKTRLQKLAVDIDAGVSPILDIQSVYSIIESNIYTFTNKAVVLEIASKLRYNYEFVAMIKNYCTVEGVCAALVENPNIVNCPYELKTIAEINNGNTAFLYKMFSDNRIKDVLWEYSFGVLSHEYPTLKRLLVERLVPATKIKWAEDYVWEFENKERVLNGSILDDKDLRYAQTHAVESCNYSFLKTLAQKSVHQDALFQVALNAKKLSKAQAIEIDMLLLNNSAYKNKNVALSFLIENLNDKSSLQTIKPYCNDALFTKWLNRMQALGYMGDRGRIREINERNPVKSGGGCALWFVVIISSLGAIISHCL